MAADLSSHRAGTLPLARPTPPRSAARGPWGAASLGLLWGCGERGEHPTPDPTGPGDVPEDQGTSTLCPPRAVLSAAAAGEAQREKCWSRSWSGAIATAALFLLHFIYLFLILHFETNY